jgi:hypothetical protein
MKLHRKIFRVFEIDRFLDFDIKVWEVIPKITFRLNWYYALSFGPGIHFEFAWLCLHIGIRFNKKEEGL